MLETLNDRERRLSGGAEPTSVGRELIFLLTCLVVGVLVWRFDSADVALLTLLGVGLGRVFTLLVRRSTASYVAPDAIEP